MNESKLMNESNFDSLDCMVIVGYLEDYVDKVPMTGIKYLQVHHMIRRLKKEYQMTEVNDTPVIDEVVDLEDGFVLNAVDADGNVIAVPEVDAADLADSVPVEIMDDLTPTLENDNNDSESNTEVPADSATTDVEEPTAEA